MNKPDDTLLTQAEQEGLGEVCMSLIRLTDNIDARLCCANVARSTARDRIYEALNILFEVKNTNTDEENK